MICGFVCAEPIAMSEKVYGPVGRCATAWTCPQRYCWHTCKNAAQTPSNIVAAHVALRGPEHLLAVADRAISDHPIGVHNRREPRRLLPRHLLNQRSRVSVPRVDLLHVHPAVAAFRRAEADLAIGGPAECGAGGAPVEQLDGLRLHRDLPALSDVEYDRCSGGNLVVARQRICRQAASFQRQRGEAKAEGQRGSAQM